MMVAMVAASVAQMINSKTRADHVAALWTPDRGMMALQEDLDVLMLWTNLGDAWRGRGNRGE